MSSKFQDLLSHALYLLVKKRLSLAFILLTFTLLAAACGQAAVAPTVSLAVTANNAPMHIQDAWLYPPAIDNTAVYFTLINPGTADKLLSVSVGSFQSAELHETTTTNNMSGMQSFKGGVEVPANGTLIFQPGGYHIMATGPLRTFAAGDKIPLTLMFANAPALTIDAIVRAP